MRGGAERYGRRGVTPGGRALIALAFLLAGCAPTESGSGSPKNADAVGEAARDFRTRLERTPRAELLNLEEIRPFLLLGFDIRVQPMLDPTVIDLRSISGPCGAPVATPFSPTKGFIVYRSTETLTIEAIASPGDAAAAAFVKQLAADVHAGCPAFSETRGGVTSKVIFERTIPLADVGIDRIGFEQRLSGASSYSHRYVMAVSGGPRVTLLVVMSNDVLVADNLNPVLKQAVTALPGSTP